MRFRYALPKNRPDVQRRGQRKDQTGKEDRRSGELKAAVFLILKVRGADFDKEQNSKDHVNDRKDNLVDDVLDLPLGGFPRVFNCAGHVSGGKGGRRKQ